MTKKVVIDDNDILEIKFLDKKINRTIAFVFGGLILIVVIASALSSWSYDASKGKSFWAQSFTSLNADLCQYIGKRRF